MFLDLNVKWSEERAKQLAGEALALGFGGIAFDVAVDGANLLLGHGKAKKSAQQGVECLIQFVDSTPSATALLGANGCSSSKALSELRLCSLNALFDAHSEQNKASALRQFARLSVKITHPDQVSAVNQIAKRTGGPWDIIAITPSDEKTWQTAVNSTEADIISLDLGSSRLPYPLKRAQLGLAVRKGLFFELCAHDVIQSNQSRKNFFCNVQQLIKFVPHSQIIITSGAKDVLGLRGPYDFINFAQLLGIKSGSAQAKGTVSENAFNVLLKAAARRTGGIIAPLLDSVAIGTSYPTHAAVCERRGVRCEDLSSATDDDRDEEMSG